MSTKSDMDIFDQIAAEADAINDAFINKIESSKGKDIFRLSRTIYNVFGAHAGLDIDDNGDVHAYVRGDVNLTRVVQKFVDHYMGNS